MKKLIVLTTALCLLQTVYSQSVTLKGKVFDKGKNPLANVQVKLYSDKFNMNTQTDKKGNYTLENISLGEYKISVEEERYKPFIKNISFKTYKAYYLNIRLESNNRIGEVVVTGSRERINRKKSPVVVNIIGKQTFDQVQAVSLGEAISFQPGLRYEDNCQNCGFNQLRMNGLDGMYTQFLIDSRPIFSALASIYGLDQIPTSMIDRVEVVSGGGSSLYGGNAIAGTVNIITRDPVIDGFQVKTNTALINGERSDNNLSFATSTANDDLTLGSYFYGNFRRRNWWDANDDSFSEIPKIINNSFGFKSYYKPGERSKLKAEGHFINEFRRGGNKFDYPAHEADIAEQLDHNTYGGQLSYELNSKNHKEHYSAYISGQAVNRKSYYGAQRDPNAYGRTNDVSIIGGVQWSKKIHQFLNDKASLVSGVETQYEKVEDKIPSYLRTNDQKAYTTGIYSQFTFYPIEKLKTSVGARLDLVDINGDYILGDMNRSTDYSKGVFNPRVNLLYSLSDHWRFRASYARGFRAPQLYDETLHTTLIAGDQVFTMLSNDLKTEHSNAFTTSINWDYASPHFYTEVLLEGFYTKINDPFVNETIEDKGDYILAEQRNGKGSYVSGINFRIDNSFNSKLQTQLGLTWQTARYEEPEEILEAMDPREDDEGNILRTFKVIGSSSTKKILRTPDLYGYFTANYKMSNHVNMDLSGVYTGSMFVPYAGGGEIQLEGGNKGDTGFFDSPEFFELNAKFNYHVHLNKDYEIHLSAGVQNIFNSYQETFDTGEFRDPAFIYGPSRPRTFFIGIKIGNLD